MLSAACVFASRSRRGSLRRTLAVAVAGLGFSSPWAVTPAKAQPPAAEAPASAGKAAEEPAPKKPWYSQLEFSLLVDGYASINYNNPSPQSPTQVTIKGAHEGAPTSAIRGGNQFRAYDVSNGFALQWVGLDVAYPAAPVGGVVSLRFGPSAIRLTPDEDIAAGLGNVRQAYASWKPFDALTLDLGKFDTSYGLETLDTTGNVNYTRSPVFWYAQPATHTGLRVGYQLTPALALQGFVVNGWDVTLDNNSGKSYGVQASLKPGSTWDVGLGYLGGPEQSDHSGPAEDQKGANGRLRHLIDLYVDASMTARWRVMFNTDFVTEERPPSAPGRQANWYGAAFMTSYELTSWLFTALRASNLWDPQGVATGTGRNTKLVEGTFTMGIRATSGLLIMLDNRVDWTPEYAFFQSGADGSSRTQVTTTLGFCLTSGAQ